MVLMSTKALLFIIYQLFFENRRNNGQGQGFNMLIKNETNRYALFLGTSRLAKNIGTTSTIGLCQVRMLIP